jgi:predicted DNA-binding transcriptional regulator AlpA
MTQEILENNRRIPIKAVCELSGGVCEMTIYRWMNDARKQFPEPQRINRRRYWRLSEVVAWLDEQNEPMQAFPK